MFVLIAIAVYFGGVAVLGAIPVNAEFTPSENGIELCVRSNGIHTDYIVPVQSRMVDWRGQHPPAHFPRLERTPDYIAFGWGDRGFYLETPNWSDLKLGTALIAISGLGDGALHVEYLDQPREGERIACTSISEAQYARLAQYIQRTFKRDANGAVLRIDAPGYGDADAFYEAGGAYNLFFTCNEWVRRGLSESGIRAPAWSPFDGALIRQLRAGNGDRPAGDPPVARPPEADAP